MCGVPGCNTERSIKGFTSIAEITCGNPQCIGVGTNAEYPNADAEIIKQLNQTPNAFPTKETLNIKYFSLLITQIVEGINAHCDNEEFKKWLSDSDKVTEASILPSFIKYCITPFFTNTSRGKDPCLLLVNKSISLQKRFVQRHLLTIKRDGHRKMNQDNTKKPGKREEINTKQRKRYHEDEVYRDATKKKEGKQKAAKREKRLSGELALAHEIDLPVLAPTHLTLIADASRALINAGEMSSPNDNLAGSSTGAVFPHPQMPSAQKEIKPSSPTDVCLYSLVDGSSIDSTVVHRNNCDIGNTELVSSLELVRKFLKERTNFICKPTGTVLQAGVDVILSYLDPSLMTNIPMLKKLATKLIKEAQRKGLISLIVLLHHGGVARVSALKAEKQTNEIIYQHRRIIPLEGIAERSGGISRKTPFVMSATILASGIIDSIRKGDIFFTSLCTKCFQSSLARMVSRHLKFVIPAAVSKEDESDSDDYDSDDEEEDKKPAAVDTSKPTALKNRDPNSVKRKPTSSTKSTTNKKNKKKKGKTALIPRDEVPVEFRDKTITATGNLANGLTKDKIKYALSSLESVKYSKDLPAMNVKNKASLLVVLGTGHPDESKQKAIREHKLETISSDTVLRLLGPYMPR